MNVIDREEMVREYERERESRGVPPGHCFCGCGEKTAISPNSSVSAKRISGHSRRYVVGHNGRHARVSFTHAVPFKIGGVYCKLIALTQGQYAVVDAADHEWLSRWHWCAHWSRNSQSFYARRNVGRGSVGMHSVIVSAPEGMLPDHRNGMTLDNRRLNLRVATATQNMCNTRMHGRNTSGFRGVHLHKQRGMWAAQITYRRQTRTLGLFATPELASQAYEAEASKLHGEYKATVRLVRSKTK